MPTRRRHDHLRPLAEAFRDHLDQAFAAPTTLERFAARHRVSEARLRAAFVQLTGQRPHAYVRDRRVAAAAAMLTGTSTKVDAIARAVGWKSRKNFYRALASATGKRPGQFRRSSPSSVPGG